MKHSLPTAGKQNAFEFKSVTNAEYFYLSQHGDMSRTKPTEPTVCGSPASKVDVFAWKEGMPLVYRGKTMFEIAQMRGLLDIWTPHLRLSLHSNRGLQFKGKKALKYWKAYNYYVHRKSP